MLRRNKGQAGIGPILVVVAILGLILSFIIYALFTPVTNEFINMGTEASEDKGDNVTSFLIKLIPGWIVIIFLGMLVYAIASGGRG